MVYLGLSMRLHVNMEALNMAENIGNIARHKRAPVVVRTVRGGQPVYVIKHVPVISGQSIAHGYQEVLARIASIKGLPVCPYCLNGIFIKHSTDEVIKKVSELGYSYADELLEHARMGSEDGIHKFEKTLISNCIVEDVGGFLYTGKPPVKRTSRFQAGYMIPALEQYASTGMEAVIHSRQGLGARDGRHSIYYVELGSSIYTVSMGLDLDGIGCTGSLKREPLEDKMERMKTALEALAALIGNAQWGANRSRFLPHWDIESLVAVVSHPLPFNPAPGHYKRYILDTVARASRYRRIVSRLGGYVEVYYYVNNGAPVDEPRDGAVRVEDPIDAVLSVEDKLEDASC